MGIGAGTTNRLDAVRLAVHTAGERARGAVLASDGFFPMADGLEAAIAAGVPAVSVGCTDEDWSEPRTSYARGRCGSRRRKPLRSSAISWCATEDVLDRPTACPISRIDGG